VTHDLLDGVMLLWFIEVALAAAWVAIDIQWTPEAAVMKWGFVIVSLDTGPLGALLYAVSCGEPLPGTREAFVAVKWRQVVGSTMHCVAGDGIGILLAATVTALLKAGLPLQSFRQPGCRRSPWRCRAIGVLRSAPQPLDRSPQRGAFPG
jgi:hypothetical protein